MQLDGAGAAASNQGILTSSPEPLGLSTTLSISHSHVDHY